MTKTTKQIEERAEEYARYNYDTTSLDITDHFTSGYTECAKDMDEEAIGFAEWIKNSGWKPNSNPNYWYNDEFDNGETTADLLTLYRESLKK